MHNRLCDTRRWILNVIWTCDKSVFLKWRTLRFLSEICLDVQQIGWKNIWSPPSFGILILFLKKKIKRSIKHMFQKWVCICASKTPKIIIPRIEDLNPWVIKCLNPFLFFACYFFSHFLCTYTLLLYSEEC